ncbi:HprK-related kinase B [Epibacterium sp. SM1979]|uniref:HprK-related kinase B n=1 Tax=Tritonibacter litoralis TaxID=2662264 RepID=A0A843YLY5_9RHOB|nr:HprK-related kinase B [Tritonibacter litoralis]MQQ10199.1 HprK-related kinase B [Tritonibacter litoralis]
MNTQDILNRLDRSALDDTAPLTLKVGHLRVQIRALPPLMDELRSYFADAVADDGPVDARIDVLEGQALDPAPDWQDWAREPGKTGRKDAYVDLQDARLIYKVRTGVTFLQSADHIVAFGPTASHPNQVVNFINTQILNQCLREGWQICHAAAVTNGTRSLAIAGLSGGGKSTSILRMMDLDNTRFVTNDRLMVQVGTPVPTGLGIPKHPRINPGTILGNPRLHPMLSKAEMERLHAMETDELWDLEEKHDLLVPDIYGADRIQYSAPLTDFWVLNWQRGGAEPTQVTQVDLATRPDLLSAIMKSAGPFYQDQTGRFLQDSDPLDPAPYLAALSGVTISEVSGRVDFDALAQIGAKLFE